MSFSFEILPEGSLSCLSLEILVFSFFSSGLDWGSLYLAIRDLLVPFTRCRISLFLGCETCDASGAANLMAATVYWDFLHRHHGLIHAAL